jgi:hypothetical protein
LLSFKSILLKNNGIFPAYCSSLSSCFSFSSSSSSSSSPPTYLSIKLFGSTRHCVQTTKEMFEHLLEIINSMVDTKAVYLSKEKWFSILHNIFKEYLSFFYEIDPLSRYMSAGDLNDNFDALKSRARILVLLAHFSLSEDNINIENLITDDVQNTLISLFDIFLNYFDESDNLYDGLESVVILFILLIFFFFFF